MYRISKECFHVKSKYKVPYWKILCLGLRWPIKSCQENFIFVLFKVKVIYSSVCYSKSFKPNEFLVNNILKSEKKVERERYTDS